MAFFAISYVGLAIGFVVIVYATTFVGFKYKTVFAMVKKNKVTQNTERQVHLVHLERLMQQEKIFTDTLLTLPKVADKMHIPPYLLSQLVNDEYNKSFSEYVNLYRIENAKQLLKADTQQKLKIAAVAFEAGFNTLSAFNTAFKKYVHQTPSEYRKTLAESQKK
jgi:AraC-like DNA-binding protein